MECARTSVRLLPVAAALWAAAVLQLLPPTEGLRLGHKKGAWDDSQARREVKALMPLKDPCSVTYATLSRYYNATLSLPAALQPIQFAFGRPSDVRGCTGSVPFNPVRDLGTLDSVIKIFENFYSLKHIAKQSPEPRLASHYDIVANLQRLGRMKQSSKARQSAQFFYEAMATTVDGLNDGHTNLQLSFLPFIHRLSLPLVGIVERGRNVVRAAPASMVMPDVSAVSSLAPFSFDPTPFYGAKVLKINGNDAWAHVLRFANTKTGNYHDLGQRLNSAFAHTAYFDASPYQSYGAFGSRSYDPKADYVEMVLIRQGSKKRERVRVPWISTISIDQLPALVNSSAFYSYFWAPPVSPVDWVNAASASAAVSRAGSVPMGRKPFRKEHYQKKARPLSMSGAVLLSQPGDYWKVYKLGDNKTAVVSLSNFSPLIFDFLGMIQFFGSETIKAFNTANQMSQIIIDLSMNGGGILNFAWWVMELLLGTAKYPNPRTEMQSNHMHLLADTPLVLQLRDLGLGSYSYGNFASLDETQFTAATSSSFFYPIITQKFGLHGEPGNYSSAFKESDVSISEWYRQPFAPAFGTKPFLLFSDGQCSSTCSMFATGMRERFGTPLVTIGGIKGKRMAFGSAGGGFTSENVTSDILETFTSDIRHSPSAPRSFGVNMNMALRWSNGFLNETAKNPIEFTYVPGDAKVDYSLDSIADPTLQYLTVAKVFDGPLFKAPRSS